MIPAPFSTMLSSSKELYTQLSKLTLYCWSISLGSFAQALIFISGAVSGAEDVAGTENTKELA